MTAVVGGARFAGVRSCGLVVVLALRLSGQPAAGSALRRWNAGVELAGPGAGVWEVELRAPSGEREPSGEVQQPIAQPLGSAGRIELAVEQ